MEFYQDDDWLEEEPEEVYDNEIEYLYCVSLSPFLRRLMRT